MFERIGKTLLTGLVLAALPMATADDKLRDPTRPAGTVEAPVSERVTRFTVSAIFIAEHRRVAVVNGRAVSVGDRIQGAEVRGVTAHNVELLYRGRTLRVPLDLARIRE